MSTVVAASKTHSVVLMEEFPDGEIQDQFPWPHILWIAVVLDCLIN